MSSNDFTSEEINQIAELAASLTPISDIGAIMDIPEPILLYAIRDKDSEVSKAYRGAKARTALELRKQEIELAKVGSPLAATMVRDYLVNMTQEEED